MSLRFQSQLLIDCLPDEQLENQFEVIMPTLPLLSKANSGLLGAVGLDSYTPIVEEITFGVKNFTTDTRRVRTGWCNVPADIENYKDIVITFFCSSGMLTQYYLAAWKSLVFDEDGEYYNPMHVYKKNIEVFFYGPGNVGAVVPPVAHYTLYGCFPYSQDLYKLKYESEPKRLRITQSFKCDKIVADYSLAKSSIIAETVTSPTSIVDKAITGLTSDPVGYKFEDVYK